MATKAKALKRQKATQAPVEQMMTVPAPANALEVPSVYSNIIEVLSMNHIDVRIAFNEVVIETNNQMRTVRRANIIMPVPAFLGMVQVLTGNAQLLVSATQDQAARTQAHIQSQIEAAMQSRLATQNK